MMNNNLLCCVECVINNTAVCNYCSNYDFNECKIKSSDNVIKFKTNSHIEELNINIHIDKLQKIFSRLNNRILYLCGFNSKYLSVSIQFFGEFYCNVFPVNHNMNRIYLNFDILELPEKLQKLIICGNSTSKIVNGKINVLPSGLKKIICKYIHLEKLSNLPDELEYLDCSFNSIKDLNNIPWSLKYLNCGSNKLECVDNLHNGLEYLNCENNSILNLDNLPSGLKYLFMDGNRLKSIPRDLPKTIVQLNSSIYETNHGDYVKLLKKYNYTRKNITNSFDVI